MTFNEIIKVELQENIKLTKLKTLSKCKLLHVLSAILKNTHAILSSFNITFHYHNIISFDYFASLSYYYFLHFTKHTFTKLYTRQKTTQTSAIVAPYLKIFIHRSILFIKNNIQYLETFKITNEIAFGIVNTLNLNNETKILLYFFIIGKWVWP